MLCLHTFRRMKEDEHPVRPGEKDCSFYLKTGRCDFGEFCRFNHPKVRNNIIYLAYSKLQSSLWRTAFDILLGDSKRA